MHEFETILTQRIADCQSRREALIADDRADEAIFARVQENVYDLFRTVLTTAVRTRKDAPAAKAFFQQKLADIPENWRESLKKAIDHSDADKIQIEIMKLEAVSDIAAIMERTWRDEA